MKKWNVSVSLLVLLTVFFLTSCQKENNIPFDEPAVKEGVVAEAKAWFVNGPVSVEKKVLDLPLNVLPETAPQRLFARMGKMQKKLEWENAAFYNQEGLIYLVVPVTTKLKKYGNDYEVAKSVVFYKKKGDEMKMNVVEVLSKKGTSLQGKAMEIMASAFLNSLKDKNEPVSGINATVFFYNESYKALGNYQFDNGNFIPYSGKLQNKRMDEESQTVNSGLTETELCQVWNVFLNTYDEWGVLISQVFLFSYEVGTCGGNPNEDQMPEGGGGEQGIPVPPITINVQHNCLNRAILDLVGASNSNTSTSGISNLVTSLFSTTYTSPYAYANLNVQQSNPPTTYSAWTTQNSAGNYTINMNPFFFNGQSIGGQLISPTKEFWSSQFIHEIVHTFILEMGIHQSIATNGFAQHELMISTWVSSISSLLQSMYSMSPADGNALALSGMSEVLQRNNTIATSAWESYIFRHYQTTTIGIKNAVADYMTGIKGTRICN